MKVLTSRIFRALLIAQSAHTLLNRSMAPWSAVTCETTDDFYSLYVERIFFKSIDSYHFCFALLMCSLNSALTFSNRLRKATMFPMQEATHFPSAISVNCNFPCQITKQSQHS